MFSQSACGFENLLKFSIDQKYSSSLVNFGQDVISVLSRGWIISMKRSAVY